LEYRIPFVLGMGQCMGPSGLLGLKTIGRCDVRKKQGIMARNKR